MKLLSIGTLFATVALGTSSVLAHTQGIVHEECPLDGTKFDALEDFSGTTFSTRLDFKKLGPTASPWALPQCPKCHFPLYQKSYTDAELAKLKAIVAEERFRTEAPRRSPYFVLGMVFEEMKAPPMKVGFAFLQASWEIEPGGAESYAEVAQRAIVWFDRAAGTLEKKAEDRADWQVAHYLPIELHRRMGNYAEASQRLQKLNWAKPTDLEWLEDALKLESQLVAAKDLKPHEFPERKRR